MDSLHIAVVILNYNSENDLQICAEQIAGQQGVRLSIVLVDNASRPESLQAIKTLLATWRPDAVCGTENAVNVWVQRNPVQADRSGNVYLIESHENRGYSAGNNIGMRLAETLGADAVLVVNPDMRIDDSSYIGNLARVLFSDPQQYVAASRIVDLQGQDQNPLREPTFWEELLWPRWILRRFFKQISYIMPYTGCEPITVPKVSGCCMLLKMDFLRKSNYLDENVFLYCEEPILSAKVFLMKGKIVYVPTLTAVHAHVKNEKGNTSQRMLRFIESRKYYISRYSGYSRLRKRLLYLSYAVLSGYYTLKGGRSK